MTEPKRWIDERPPEAIERLLHAAVAERPTEQSLARTLTVLGVGVGASGAAVTAGAATAGAAASTGAVAGGALGVGAVVKTGLVVTSGLVKWGAVVTALAVTVVGGNAVLNRVRRPASRDERTTAAPASLGSAAQRVEAGSGTHSHVADPANAAAANAAAANAAAANAVVPGVTKNSSKPRPVAEARPAVARAPHVVEAPPADTERLAEEVALVDRARGALARDDAAGALGALDEYDARFSQRRFAPEALYLRMESLLRAGRPDAAGSVAHTLANTYPTSPHAARARQVLAQTIP